MTKEKYAEIINLPHHTSDRHQRMSMYDRAAQFSPFAALTGYDAAIKETARQTKARPELSEDSLEHLDEQMSLLRAKAGDKPVVRITHFVADKTKSGGKLIESCGKIQRVDTVGRKILLINGEAINIDDVVALDSDVFDV